MFFQRLFLFRNLEYFGVFLQEGFENHQDTIKKFISVIYSSQTKLKKFKVHKYIWDIEKLRCKSILEFIKCQFSPVDLMILAALCEEMIFENVICIDLSDNIGVVDSNFNKNVARVVKALKCDEVIIKNSRCKQKHIKKIQKFVGNQTRFFT